MDELSHEAVRLLQASQIAESPSAEVRRRIRVGLAAATGAAVLAGSGSGSATAAIAGSAGTTKVIITALVAGVIGFGSGALVVHAVDTRRDPAPAPAPARATAQLASAPDPLPRAPEPAPDRAIAPPRDRATAIPPKPAVRATPAPAEPELASPAAPAADDTGLAAELGVIRAADEALAMDYPGRVLVLVDDHATRFPEGQLSQERESLRVLALCKLGRTDDAQVAARAFFQRWPGSPHAGRLRASCAAGTE